MTTAPATENVRERIEELAQLRGGTLESVIAAFHRARAEVAGLFALVGVDPTKTRESARELGINPSTLYRQIRRLGIEVPDTDGRGKRS